MRLKSRRVHGHAHAFEEPQGVRAILAPHHEVGHVDALFGRDIRRAFEVEIAEDPPDIRLVEREDRAHQLFAHEQAVAEAAAVPFAFGELGSQLPVTRAQVVRVHQRLELGDRYRVVASDPSAANGSVESDCVWQSHSVPRIGVGRGVAPAKLPHGRSEPEQRVEYACTPQEPLHRRLELKVPHVVHPEQRRVAIDK
jgi:hypothetical protein